ncbi:JNK1/MAPK8-associated membrane protein-like [Paramacrobiotus metropolitanus]|uniref:JNK1/MAPK8-associated membrane protein-like n=1 Tax=Paramacrobiotus metropolitanus TaxID=2943436 RepID=UPI002445B11B|nr:JNK1/MAPK8-associated membrane protein-like [Paramacrobiotus metropolitanus]
MDPLHPTMNHHNLTSTVERKFVQLQYLGTLTLCPGYCGRIATPDNLLSECMACPRGTRASQKNSLCEPCQDFLTPYAWMYLAFMAALPLIFHLTVIDMIFRKWRRKSYVILQLSALLEAAASAVITMAFFRKDDQFRMRFCGADRLADWYSVFHNPKPDYIHTLNCSQEVVYPLYSVVFVYYFLSLLLMLICRGVSAKWSWNGMARNALLGGLYQYPVLLAVHAGCAGLLYFIFPYVTIIAASVTSAMHCSLIKKQTLWEILKGLFSSIHSVIVVVAHWILLGFGVLAIYYKDSVVDILKIAPSVLAPLIIYLVTFRLTDPKKYYDHFE